VPHQKKSNEKMGDIEWQWQREKHGASRIGELFTVADDQARPPEPAVELPGATRRSAGCAVAVGMACCEKVSTD
jgi:hypothetical protein